MYYMSHGAWLFHFYSITLIAPLSANAQVIRTWENDDKGFQKDTYTNEDTKKSLSEKDGFYTARRNYLIFILFKIVVYCADSKA